MYEFKPTRWDHLVDAFRNADRFLPFDLLNIALGYDRVAWASFKSVKGRYFWLFMWRFYASGGDCFGSLIRTVEDSGGKVVCSVRD